MKKEKTSVFLLIVISVVMGYLMFIESPYIGIAALLFTLASAIYNRFLTLAIYTFVSFSGIHLANYEVLGMMLIVVLVSINILFKRNRLNSRLLGIVIAYTVSIFLGSLFHVSTELDSIVLYVFKLLFMVIMAQVIFNTNPKLFLLSIILSASIISLITTYHLIVGDVNVYSETQARITYNGNIKDLATSVIIIVIFSISKLFDYKNRKNNTEYVFYALLLSGSFIILLLTYARGVLVGLVFAVLSLLIAHSSKISFSKIFLYSLMAIVLVYIVQSLQLNADLMFGNIETGGGRSEVFNTYIQFMKNSGDATLICGLGSGEIQPVPGMYPHSVILAHYFFYGVFGAIFIVSFIGFVFHYLYRNRKEIPFYFALFIQTVVMYLGHGNYADPRFWITMGLCAGMAFKSQETQFDLIKQ